MEILPIDKITEDLAALAELRAQIRNLEKIVDDGLMEFDLYLFRSYGDTGYEFRMSELTAQAISLLDASRQSILKDGLIGQLELKAGIVKPLEEEQYHEKILQTEEALESMLYADEKEEARQKQNSVLFIANRMEARMRQISLTEEDFYYKAQEIKNYYTLIKRYDAEAENLFQAVEELSDLTSAYLAGYLHVINTIKDVVLGGYIYINIRPS